ncbi:hypothetical protein SIM91_02895 [Rhodococcus opacus]|uniref:hypothetical protein n=1 Tax=Rhodococcus opacus TaxID=37919 RepID=UPI000A880BBE|nr:hypothetical protein [Rhodococcus opacus]MDX5962290.1 hypothetical protein [Rhodococcus opacus]NKY74818.1 hypothetical protein [Rhodococcus opacus]CAG7641677.1 hypothetical protein E143388_08308 [Rhodococcus opacus]
MINDQAGLAESGSRKPHRDSLHTVDVALAQHGGKVPDRVGLLHRDDVLELSAPHPRRPHPSRLPIFLCRLHAVAAAFRHD